MVDIDRWPLDGGFKRAARVETGREGKAVFAYRPSRNAQLRARLVATYDHSVTRHEWATGYRWDIVLTGSRRTPFEAEEDSA